MTNKQIEINQIHEGDCMEIMQQIPNNTIDLLLTDPPYNISMKSGFHTMGRKGVDFGEWDKGFNQQTWLEQACTKVRTGGSAVVFNDYKNIGQMADVFATNGFTVKEMLIWQKPNPMPRNRDRLYVTSIEVALWAVKGKGWTFNRQRENYENALFKSPTVSPKQRVHPTQKPEKILREILAIHSNEGDLVLDCFAGSGSTCLSARGMGRNFVGIEQDPEYARIANERLAAAIF